ncbi:hypothetical protein OXPF_12260 [Oxobacter pfennigii]|uniref:DUF4363 family protein n=1 Tax=Oxobacter pfennigii TaxID=36849 RepID=A0A0P8WBN6_9CLOT|nr:DUF4363 family protein [Oxobacter pfennigii]KPU45333.1 hypothetical protein OXPF_12260 [Oxobacter pfennigii]
MKKILLAVAIIIAISCTAIYSLHLYKTTSETLSKRVDNIIELVTLDKWEEASEKIKDFEEAWEDIENVWTLLIDHFEIDNIEMSLKKAGKYIETKNKPLSLAELETLDFMVEHILEKEVFNLKNVF